jgi:3-oxoacyl-[acyl-carrier protein] reductase
VAEKRKRGIERVVLVSGAASGIGAAVCRRIAGLDTALLMHTRRNREALEAVATEARQAGAETHLILGDLGETGTGASLVAAALEHFGRLDQIVSNAGFADRRPIGEVDAETLRRSMAAMPEAFFEIATAALEPLRASPWGRVVAISSFIVHVFGASGTSFAATAAAKAGVESLAKNLALQLAPDGVSVNCVAPGFTRKDATGHSALPGDFWDQVAAANPMGRIALPADTAAAVNFLLSREAHYITGQVIHVDGGLTLL